ncbi:short chain oxidoreductase [Coniophora puteana RWD-64-598 SS2]|uniref:Short chain oxidoreductase n=1 Tax=Coniophora puteana (strain RWD-64-598) TaxID=741705 RepID=A0A5M3M9I8_CONPW|nr:short chain oxidoreductase [Coniophora puteana RWD-64-598 SS2]EIW75524.1 short chain oxidoreductase [Coniophora puteana RWD-64-598 SS2]
MPSKASKGVALITGCAQGLGRAIATRLATDGYAIALVDLPSKREAVEELASELGKKLDGIRTLVALADVTIEDQVRDAVEKAAQELGGVDVLVTSAGIVRINLICDVSEKEWDDVIGVNLKGTFLCYKHVGLQMIKQGRGGRMIGISSIAGKKGLALASAYSASKFAVRGLTQSAAAEFGPHGITVNAVAPGGVDTALLRAAQSGIKSTAESRQDVPWQGTAHALSATTAALGVLAEPEDIAGTVSYLVSPDARYISGQTINVDGGIQYD